MVVFSLTQAPQRVRGLLSRYCLEIRSGLFIGRLDKRMRLKLWNIVEEEATMKTSAVMAWSRASDQGYAFRSLGPLARRTIQYDGLWLISTDVPGAKPTEKQIQEP